MTRFLRITITAEGSTDEWLRQPVRWIVQRAAQAATLDLRIEFCTRDRRGMSVAARVEHALEAYPCDVCVVHRDEDRAGVQARRGEIERVRADVPLVPCVPVVSSEAWLLMDDAAIRRAANNPAGTRDLDLPRAAAIERCRDPKAVLTRAMLFASGLGARRRQPFMKRQREWPSLVGAHIVDYRAHLAIPAFSAFALALESAIRPFLR